MYSKIFTLMCFSLAVLIIQAVEVKEINEKATVVKKDLENLKLKATQLVIEAAKERKINSEKKSYLLKELDDYLIEDKIAIDVTKTTYENRAKKIKDQEILTGEVLQAKRGLSAEYLKLKVKYNDVIKQL